MMPTTLYLIRHGQPNATHYDGKPQIPLSTLGQEQARHIAEWLGPKGIETIFCSPYSRAQQTAKPFAEATKLPIATIEALREREKEWEAHESLVQRVTKWWTQWQATTQKVAIFSHCGPINMLVAQLDPLKEKLAYPYTCPHGCHTPIAGIWELQLQHKELDNGLLHTIDTGPRL